MGRIISVSLAAAILAGCDDRPRFLFVGHWLGHRAVAPNPRPDVAVSLAEVEVLIHDDGRFDLGDGGLDYSGQVAYDGGVAVLAPDLVEGKPVERQSNEFKKMVPRVTLTPNADGKTLTATEIPGDRAAVVLRRLSS